MDWIYVYIHLILSSPTSKSHEWRCHEGNLDYLSPQNTHRRHRVSDVHSFHPNSGSFKSILKSKMTILNEYTHKFSPCGVTCLFALSESHVSCHTWPEFGRMNADFFTCGEKDPRISAKYIINALESEKYRIRIVKR